MIDFEKELNAEQWRAVREGDAPCLVLAGAGSGKTRTIAYRVAYLLEKGVAPENILLVTFTNKAAEAMKTRVESLVGRAEVLPWSGTFHHIGYRLLKQYASLIGFTSAFTVLDSDDSETLIKVCIKNQVEDTRGRRFPSASALHSVLSFVRNAEKGVAEVLEERHPEWLPWGEEIANIAREYAERKRKSNALDFDDLLAYTVELLQNNPNVREKLSTLFRYVIVDEYQDTNRVQATLVKLLSGTHQNVLVVGDDAQSIYSFRAADIQNILQFPKEFPGAKVFKLETNYRSTQAILDVANAVIEENTEQYQKHLAAARSGGEKPELHPFTDAAGEARWAADTIEQLLAGNTSPREIAVLFRAAYHSQPLEVELVHRGIPYEYRGGVRFFERAHIKDALAYLRIVVNPADASAWLRILTHEEGVGPVAAEKVVTVMNATVRPEEIPALGASVLSGKALRGWENFCRIWQALLHARPATPANLIEALLASPYREYITAEYDDSRDRISDLHELSGFAERYETLAQFAAEAALQESYRAGENLNAGQSQQQIVLSTIHQAKGLEWAAVFVINLAANAFPSERAVREAALSEERRLFYVAITRAKEKLFLSYPLVGGSFGDMLGGPSMFLEEIPATLLEDFSPPFLPRRAAGDSSEIIYVPDEDVPFPTKPRPAGTSFLKDIDEL